MQFPRDTKKIIGMDLDDVLADFVERFILIANQKYSRPVDISVRPTDWEWSNMGLTSEEIDGVWEVILTTENFWETLNPMPGVSRTLIRQLNYEAKLYFPTARAVCPGRDTGEQSASWIDRKFGILHPTVFVSDAKGPLAQVLKYDYFIDDRPKNCLAVKEASPSTKVFLNYASHNWDFDAEKNGIVRVANVNEFAKIVLA